MYISILLMPFFKCICLIQSRSNVHIVLCQSFCSAAYGRYLPVLLPLYFYSVAWKKIFQMQIQIILLVSLLRSSWNFCFHKSVWSLEDSNPRKGTCLYSLRFLRHLKGQLAPLQVWASPA